MKGVPATCSLEGLPAGPAVLLARSGRHFDATGDAVNRVVYVSVGDMRDPATVWCRWGGDAADWRVQGDGPILFRDRQRGRMGRLRCMGLRADGFVHHGGGWWGVG